MSAEERRAMKLYPLYKKVTHNKDVQDELDKIILEETNHRIPLEKQVEQICCENNINPETFLKIEEKYFLEFEKVLEQLITQPSSPDKLVS